MYGGVRGRKTRVGEKLHRFPPTRLYIKWLLIVLKYKPLNSQLSTLNFQLSTFASPNNTY